MNSITTPPHVLDLATLPTQLQDALDDAALAKSTAHDRSRALNTLEQLLALTCIPRDTPNYLNAFLDLQLTFECNIPSRLLAWIASVTSRIENLCLRGSLDTDREAELAALVEHVSQSLCLIQGVALHHTSSKRFLTRKHALQVLLDLLLVSRHVAPTAPSVTPTIHLSSTVLDTLLCVLVDDSTALRTFEEAGGVQAAVKILKRAGTPREVRMKCLEFLYFYLMDETSDSLDLPQSSVTSPSGNVTSTSSPSSPSASGVLATPKHGRTRSLANLPNRRSTSSSSSSSSAGSAGCSTPGRSLAASTYSTASEASTTYALRMSSLSPQTSPSGPTTTESRPRALAQLQTDAARRPATPRAKTARIGGANVARLPSGGAGMSTPVHAASPATPIEARRSSATETPRPVPMAPATPARRSAAKPGHGRSKSAMTGLSVGAAPTPMTPTTPAPPPSAFRRPVGDKENARADGRLDRKSSHVASRAGPAAKRTTEEKKAILGGMMGNVDALLEGVKRAGIWGLS